MVYEIFSICLSLSTTYFNVQSNYPDEYLNRNKQNFTGNSLKFHGNSYNNNS